MPGFVGIASGGGGTTSSRSWTPTFAGGTDTGVALCAERADVGAAVTAMSIGGIPCDILLDDDGPHSDYRYSVAIGVLTGTPSGATTCEITFAAGCENWYQSVELDDLHQTTPERAVQPAGATSGSPSTTIASDAADLVLDAVCKDSSAVAADAGQTSRYADSGSDGKGVSTEPGAASVTMSWTTGMAGSWGAVAVSFQPPASGGAAETVEPAFIASTATVPEPALVLGAVQVQPGFIAGTAAVYSPSIVPGAVQLQPAFIPSSSTVYSPAVAPGAVAIAPSFIASGGVVFQPSITEGAPGEAIVQPSFIGSTSAVFAPTFAPGSVAVAPAFISSAAQVFDPSLVASAVVVAPHAIASGAVVFAPAFVGGAAVVLPAFIVSAATVYGPSLIDSAAEPYAATATTVAHWRTSGSSVAHWRTAPASVPYWQATASTEG